MNSSKELNKSTSGPATPPEKNKKLSGWIVGWFYVTAIICTWDATFIMLRPYTLPGGSLAWFWYLYKYYVTVDQRYQDIDDAYVFAQSLLNYAEVVLNIVAIIMHYRRSRHTVATAFMVSVMTFWKTVLYFLMFSEFCTGGIYRIGNTFMQEFFLVVIPNIIWVILPFGVMYELWGQLIPSGQVVSSHQKGQPIWHHDGDHVIIKNGHVNGVALNGNGVVNGKRYAVNGHTNGLANGQVLNRKGK